MMAFGDKSRRQRCSQQVEDVIDDTAFAKILRIVYYNLSGMSANNEQALQKAVLLVVVQQMQYFYTPFDKQLHA